MAGVLNVPILVPLNVTSCSCGIVRISSAAMFLVKKYVMSTSGIVLSLTSMASAGTLSEPIASDLFAIERFTARARTIHEPSSACAVPIATVAANTDIANPTAPFMIAFLSRSIDTAKQCASAHSPKY